MLEQLYNQMINTRRKVVNNDTAKHILLIKKRVEALRKLFIKRLSFVKRNLKINTQTFIIVVTKLAVIDASIIKLLLN